MKTQLALLFSCLLVATLSGSVCRIDSTPEISPDLCVEIQPYLLPQTHYLKPILDELFYNQRATFDDATFERAGFEVLYSKERSFIRVARHPLLPDHLVKAYLDMDLRKKNQVPGWIWLKRRCHGAKKIRHVIKKYSLRHFQVPDKWLYPLPSKPFLAQLSHMPLQPLLLIVEDMDLVSEDENLLAWRTEVTKEYLDELFLIISKAGGSSYRPANIWMSRNGRFSFIDTEYPHRKPDFHRIRPYLSTQMRAYWDQLVNAKQAPRKTRKVQMSQQKLLLPQPTKVR
jgi:hypothetical protein